MKIGLTSILLNPLPLLAQIYSPIPNFMYVSRPTNVEYPVTIVFEYGKFLEFVGVITSLVTLILLVTYAVLGKKQHVLFPLRSFKRKIGNGGLKKSKH